MTSLQEEIQHVLAGLSVPGDVSRTVSESMARLEANRIAPGLEPGEKAPDFTLPNRRGERVSLSQALARGPAVVSFFRGAWCPICNLQLLAFNRAIDRIEAAGGALLAIHPDRPPASEDYPDYQFELLLDADQSVIEAYRLQYVLPAELQKVYLALFQTDVSQRNADGSWRLPTPGTFVIGSDGIIRRRHVTADFTRRMEPDEVVSALQELRRRA